LKFDFDIDEYDWKQKLRTIHLTDLYLKFYDYTLIPTFSTPSTLSQSMRTAKISTASLGIEAKLHWECAIKTEISFLNRFGFPAITPT
ncbi:MAG: hypothetical protein WBX78_00740, partial [Pseudolabrys sp.]